MSVSKGGWKIMVIMGKEKRTRLDGRKSPECEVHQHKDVENFKHHLERARQSEKLEWFYRPVSSPHSGTSPGRESHTRVCVLHNRGKMGLAWAVIRHFSRLVEHWLWRKNRALFYLKFGIITLRGSSDDGPRFSTQLKPFSPWRADLHT